MKTKGNFYRHQIIRAVGGRLAYIYPPHLGYEEQYHNEEKEDATKDHSKPALMQL